MFYKIDLALLCDHVAVDIQTLSVETFHTCHVYCFFLLAKAFIKGQGFDHVDNKTFSHFQKLDQVAKNEKHWWDLNHFVLITKLREKMRPFVLFLELGLDKVSVKRDIMLVSFFRKVRSWDLREREMVYRVEVKLSYQHWINVLLEILVQLCHHIFDQEENLVWITGNKVALYHLLSLVFV